MKFADYLKPDYIDYCGKYGNRKICFLKRGHTGIHAHNEICGHVFEISRHYKQTCILKSNHKGKHRKFAWTYMDDMEGSTQLYYDYRIEIASSERTNNEI